MPRKVFHRPVAMESHSCSIHVAAMARVISCTISLSAFIAPFSIFNAAFRVGNQNLLQAQTFVACCDINVIN